MADSQMLKDSLPYIIIGTVTLLLVGLGVVLFSQEPQPELTDDQKDSILVQDYSIRTGSPDAKVQIVDFSDFGCSHCADFNLTVNTLKTQFGDDVEFVSRIFVLGYSQAGYSGINLYAADAALAANAQDKYTEFKGILFLNQGTWSGLDKELAYAKFTEYAEEAGVEDIDQFKSDMKSAAFRDQIETDFDNAVSLGVTGTPGIFLNGEAVVDRSLEALTVEIQTILESTDDADVVIDSDDSTDTDDMDETGSVEAVNEDTETQETTNEETGSEKTK